MESDDPLGLLKSPPGERRRRRTRSRPPVRPRVRLASCERAHRPVSDYDATRRQCYTSPGGATTSAFY
eukprot:2522761-Amphidinium_carterae.1